MENNGRLSASGVFRTQRTDVEALVTFHIGEARKKWGLKATDPTDVAIYAHGGLTDEEAAAETAARWIPALYEEEIFPIFLMWETDLWSTLKNRLQDLVTGQPLVRVAADASYQLRQVGANDFLSEVLVRNAELGQKMLVEEMPIGSVTHIVQQGGDSNNADDVGLRGKRLGSAGLASLRQRGEIEKTQI